MTIILGYSYQLFGLILQKRANEYEKHQATLAINKYTLSSQAQQGRSLARALNRSLSTLLISHSSKASVLMYPVVLDMPEGYPKSLSADGRWKKLLPMREEWNSWVQIQSMGVGGTETHIYTHTDMHTQVSSVYIGQAHFNSISLSKNVLHWSEWCPSVCLLSSGWTQSWFPQYRESNTVDGTSGGDGGGGGRCGGMREREKT